MKSIKGFLEDLKEMDDWEINEIEMALLTLSVFVFAISGGISIAYIIVAACTGQGGA